MHPAVSLAVRKFQHQVSLSTGMTGFAKRFWVSILRMNVFGMIHYAIIGCIVTHVSLYKHEKKKKKSFKFSVFVVRATVDPAVSLVVDKLEHQVSLSSGMTVFADRVSSLKMNMFGIIYAIHGRTVTHVS